VAAARWERVGAIFGIAFVVLIVVSFFTPSTPNIDDPIGEAEAAIRDDEDGLLLSVYLGGLASIAFLPFLSTLWRVLRRDEEGGVFSGALLAAGILTVAGVLAANGAVASLVVAVDEGFSNEAVQALIALDNTLFLAALFGFAAFHGAAAAAILTTGALPR
jgi:hypothetical protein